MSPFHRARQAAVQLRQGLFGTKACEGLCSEKVIEAVAAESGEDFDIALVHPSDASLGTAHAVLLRELRQIIVRNDVSHADRAFLIAHEFGHWKLHPADHGSCHKLIDVSLKPEDTDAFGTQKVEAYGARERAELQANIFAREFLLPRETAKVLFFDGKTAVDIQRELNLPLELVRQQLLDGLLLPTAENATDTPEELITPTHEQITAAQSKARTSLVVAGPGTGKTATLLMRVQHLLAQGVKPSEILLLTFSNRAARELVDRLHVMGVADAHDIWIGTFHAFGLEFLRKNHDQFDLKPLFGVADKMAQIALLEPHIYGLGLEAYNPLGDPLDWLNETVKAIQRAKDELADASTFSLAVEKSAPKTTAGVLAKQRDIVKLYRCYEAKLRASGNLVDMGDLIMLPALGLSRAYGKFAQTVGRFKHILVDEYQDVNRASANLVKALAAHADSLWVVGDARQAIYRFRGASMRNIVRFGDDFPKYKEFSLSENRRSHEEIVRVFEHTGRSSNPLQMVLPLDDVHAVRGASGVKPLHIVCDSDDVLQDEVAKRANKLNEQGVSYRNQVILASTHDTCTATADALNASGTPALHLGDIFQREEVKNLLSLLQLFVDRSGSGLVRISKFPGLEIPREDVETLIVELKKSRGTALSWVTSPPAGLSPNGLEAIKRWSKALDGLNSTDSPWEVVCTLLLERTGLLWPYLSGQTIVDITRRLALWQFIYFLRVPDGGQPYQTVGSFITRLRRRLRIGDSQELRMPPPEADCLDAIAVMTIHQSKGLEFEAVHLVDVDAKHFSISRDLELVPASLLESINLKDDFEAETEASNKLYVALSRAKQHLLLYESNDRYDAQCTPAVTDAGHLFQRVKGQPSATKAPRPSSPPPMVSIAPMQPIELSGFLAYRVCPRRYYYDFIKDLTPSAGLHPAALIEGAVMNELFMPYGVDPSVPSQAVSRVLASMGESYKDALPHLKEYADQLLANGRKWLDADHAIMAKPVEIACACLPLRVSAHRITRTGSVVTLQFVRIKPSGRWTRQQKVLKWVLKYLAEAHPKYSFVGQIFVLSTGSVESVTPYVRLPADFFLVPVAKNLQSGDFTPKLNSWECPRCRHFLHCPA